MANIEIDGQAFEVENGKMIIEVADEAGIYIPRFCYHKKLSVAANCRMCLVEVENGRKTVPACATPITNGMKVFTKSKEAVRSQQAVMAFLLINHPLDCPICDQGGECELQDLSMGFGEDETTYGESKRAVANEDLGPLISTEMTRCIHCTRCVRFGDEVAGVRELGATGRGEHMQIGTYVKHSLTSPVSGNIIDLCPVGALTSKPYRFTARAWELIQHESIAPHDCLGSNVLVHVRRNEWMRVVPKDRETINETWLSDRDRFSYLGMKHPSRAGMPMIKRNGQWEAVDWDVALPFAADGIRRIVSQHGPEQLAAFASPSSTLEELFLLQKMMRALGVNHLDHRLQQTDFRDQEGLPMMPTSSLPYADIEHQETVLIVGCHLTEEVPLASVRVRKAFRNGAKVYAMNSVDYDSPFDMTEKIIVSPDELPLQLASIVLALVGDASQLPLDAQKLVIGLKPSATAKAMAKALCSEHAVVITGAICENHPDAALLRTLVALMVNLSSSRHIRLTVGANCAGAWLAGMVPHREAAGKDAKVLGLDAQAAIEAKLKGYFLMAVEPGFDFANPHRARQSMLAAEFVVMLSSFQNESIQEYADVILPISPYAETSGTYVNVDHTWQSVPGALTPFGEARPAWKVCRVLANLLQLRGFEYASSEEVLKDLKHSVDMASVRTPALFYPKSLPVSRKHLVRVGEWPLYRLDMIVRHAQALQDCASAESPCVRIHPKTADNLQLLETATVSQGDIEITLPLKRDERVAPDVIWVANAMPETVDLGHAFAEISIKP
ncbi:MAG: NADH-quinone oxidoreductase subunit NuoG [Legionellales bacterium]|nr:NADH-quinone oxidoreductase subunit NuoG [Legionellales bacterium]